MKVYLVPSDNRKTARSAVLKMVLEFLARHEIEILPPPTGRGDSNYLEQADAVIADCDTMDQEVDSSLAYAASRTEKPILALYSVDSKRHLPLQLKQRANVREIRYKALFEVGLTAGVFIRRLLKKKQSAVAA